MRKKIMYGIIGIFVIGSWWLKIGLRSQVKDIRRCDRARADYIAYKGAIRKSLPQPGKDDLFLRQMTNFAQSADFEQCLEENQQVVFRKILILQGVRVPGWGGDGERWGDNDRADSPFMLELEPFHVALADQNTKRYINLEITLELDENSSFSASDRDDNIRKVVSTTLSRQSVTDIDSPEGKMLLTNSLQQRINENIRPGLVKSLYFTRFTIE